MTPNDPYYSRQWHFDLLGDIEAIWAEFDGTGVNVGIFDDGVEQTHVDLRDNYNESLEYQGDDGEPNTTYDGHGTSVAGIIAASNNDTGGVGVAWGAQITGMDFINDYVDLAYISAFDVTNHSWGYGSDFLDYGDIGDIGSQLYWEARDFQAGVDDGRGGLGSIAVKAAGNEAANAQGEGLNSAHTVITVGALDQFGRVQDYSNFGHNLLVSAGAAAYTTDRSGGDGYNGDNETDFGIFDPLQDLGMTSQFGGTSAATPVVSGVVALMLQANEGLGWRDVQNILAVSAAHTGSRYGSLGFGDEVGRWDWTDSGTWNGGGMTFHQSYGFGSLDAFAAVRMAEFWSLMQDGARTSTNEVSRIYYDTDPVQYVYDFESVESTITVTEDMDIEHIYLTVDWYHGSNRQVEITLIAPDGTESLVFDGDASGYFSDDWTFGLRNYLGQSSVGDWTVRITDTGSGYSGRLDSVNIEFVGNAASTDTRWDFTDDFLTLAGLETGRRALDDTDGGADWINMAAITGDISVELVQSGVLRVDGAGWVTLGAGQIENMVAGDGDDRITGNASANHLEGARGHDMLFGMDGADTLGGGQGNDKLFGDAFDVGQTDVSAEVYRLYHATLGRGPDGAGHYSWTWKIVEGSHTLESVTDGFIASAEFQRTYGAADNAAFVSLLFNNVLDRDPGAGAQGWINALDDGRLTRAEVVLGFSNSAEFIAGTRGAARDFIEARSEAAWTDDVFRLYQATLDRAPDANGLANWMGQLGSGRAYLDVVTGFVASTEFQRTYGATDNAAFVTLLYDNVLDRLPDVGGLASWVDRLDSGALTRQQVVRGFAQSAEFIASTSDDVVAYMRSLGVDDTLSGGRGTNALYGGAGADKFVFDVADTGTTTVHDFEAWDWLELDGFGFASAAQALDAFTQQGDDVVFDHSGVHIVLADTDLSMLSQGSLLI